jgi:hypothetical protein
MREPTKATPAGRVPAINVSKAIAMLSGRLVVQTNSRARRLYANTEKKPRVSAAGVELATVRWVAMLIYEALYSG